MSIPKVEKRCLSLYSTAAIELVSKVFKINKNEFENFVSKLKEKKDSNSLNEKIIWWEIINGGFINGVVIKEKGARFGFRIINNITNKVYFGKPIDNDSYPEWFSDYKSWKESKITEKEKKFIQQKAYFDKKTQTTNNMIRQFILNAKNCDEIENFAKIIIMSNKYDKETKNILVQEISKWGFKSKNHNFVKKIINLYKSHCNTIPCRIDELCAKNILNNKGES